MSLRAVIGHHLLCMALQLVDSTVPTTRVYWRRWCGLPEDVANDPRPLTRAERDALTRQLTETA